jgi:hypothetical protein
MQADSSAFSALILGYFTNRLHIKPDFWWARRYVLWGFLRLLSVAAPAAVGLFAIFCATSIIFSPVLVILFVLYYHFCTAKPQLYYNHSSAKSKEILRHCKTLHGR